MTDKPVTRHDLDLIALFADVKTAMLTLEYELEHGPAALPISHGHGRCWIAWFAFSKPSLPTNRRPMMSQSDHNPEPVTLSESLDDTAIEFEQMATDAIADHEPEAAEVNQRIAGHLRRLAYNHRNASTYQNQPNLDPEQTC
ncbi:hypothetical protein BH23CHL5_BH23CHL5_03970 [soil metagenome]